MRVIDNTEPLNVEFESSGMQVGASLLHHLRRLMLAS